MSEHLSERDLVTLMGARPTPAALRPTAPTPELPIDGKAAVSRWLALHDRAATLQTTWRQSKRQLPRVVWRGIRSLFLYEHRLSPETRRRARMALWLREHEAPLPDLVTLRRWEECRCPRCQAQLYHTSERMSRLLLLAA
jgi:hypothetical protein